MKSESFDNLPAYLVEQIKKRYIENPAYGRLPSERELCDEFNVSRTSIRKSLKKLEQAKLVFKLPGGRIRQICHANWEPKQNEPNEYFSLYKLTNSFSKKTPRPESNTLKMLANDLYPGAPSRVIHRWQDDFERFRRENPLIRVKALKWPDYGENIYTGKNDGDIFEIPASNLWQLQRQNIIKDLDFFYEHDSGVNEKYFHQTAWNDVHVDGRLMALPFGMIPPCLLTRKKTWDTFGLPKIPQRWTWNDFLGIAEKQLAETGNKILCFSSPYQLLRSIGYDLCNFVSKKQRQTINSTLKRIMNVSQLDMIQPRTLPDNEKTSLFVPLTSTSIPQLESLPHAKELLILPYPANHDGVLLHNTMSLMISSSSSHPLECWQFIRNLVQVTSQKNIGLSHHMFPVLRKAGKSLTSVASPLGDLSFMSDEINGSQQCNIDNKTLYYLENKILAPELLQWHHGQSDFETTLMRIKMRYELLREKSFAAEA